MKELADVILFDTSTEQVSKVADSHPTVCNIQGNQSAMVSKNCVVAFVSSSTSSSRSLIGYKKGSADKEILLQLKWLTDGRRSYEKQRYLTD